MTEGGGGSKNVQFCMTSFVNAPKDKITKKWGRKLALHKIHFLKHKKHIEFFLKLVKWLFNSMQ